ncbi:hypothetical protein HB364_13650 [Pseudoflavitalea sp. X16]|uniref:hypothetical protein n=1 Tax=Paraflavitalea devenefica TaxID=2716334 RepID=UPI00141DE203|nr:hypothetical protein [Paraflavitalea devenefica]NII26133.1 hypothetical protein [Paraflavitalea devenefica]
MPVKPSKLYLTYEVEIGGTTFHPKIAIDNIDQADKITAAKQGHPSKEITYANFKVIQRPGKLVVKDYNYPQRARLTIDDQVANGIEKGHGPPRS